MDRPARYSRLQIFVSSSGQSTNIGDVVLRRAYLRHLREMGDLHVYLGGCDESFVEGLHLHMRDITYTSKRDWLLSSVRMPGGHPILYAFNAGETTVRRWDLRLYAEQLTGLLLGRLRGNAYGIHVGVGIRAPQQPRARLLGLVLKACQEVAWRDPESQQWTGVGNTLPDWAIMEGSNPDPTSGDADPRTLLAISMRDDRGELSAGWLDAVRCLADREGLTPIVVLQAVDDEPLARRIASSLGCEIRLWDLQQAGMRHAEDVVRGIYRKSAFVVSNRLHGLLMGATEGAIPVPYTLGSPEKLFRTFHGAGLTLEPLDWRQEGLDLPRVTPTGGMALHQEIEAARQRVQEAQSRRVTFARHFTNAMR